MLPDGSIRLQVMGEFARIWRRTQSYMEENTPQRDVYLAAVETINCWAPSLMPPWLLKSEPVNTINSLHLEPYSTEDFNLIVPPVMTKCHNLREMIFGTHRRSKHSVCSDWWIVTFPLPECDAPDTGDVGSGPTGHIVRERNITIMMEQEPYQLIEMLAAPSDLFTIQIRFNLHLCNHNIDDGYGPVLLDEWLEAIQNDPLYGHLHKSIDLHYVLVDLADLISLYERQIHCGYHDRLEHISAPFVRKYDLHDFESFAKVAAGSLTSLKLIEWDDSDDHDDDDDDVPIEEGRAPCLLFFADLPSFISTVRTALVNLRELVIPMTGSVSSAEVDCGIMLHRDILQDGGTIQTLRIISDKKTSEPIFNILRVISQLCTSTASIEVTVSVPGWASWDEGLSRDEQIEFHRFLRSQPPSQQFHLSTLDFQKFGIIRLDFIEFLHFDADGWPLRMEGYESEVEESEDSWGASDGVLGAEQGWNEEGTRGDQDMGEEKEGSSDGSDGTGEGDGGPVGE